jgi:hypothetical protein
LERAGFDGERELDLVAAGGVAVVGGRCDRGSAAAMGAPLEELQQPIFAHDVIRFDGRYIPRLMTHITNDLPSCCFATQTLKAASGPPAGFDGEREFEFDAAGGVAVRVGRCGSGCSASMGTRLEELRQMNFAHGVIQMGA